MLTFLLHTITSCQHLIELAIRSTYSHMCLLPTKKVCFEARNKGFVSGQKFVSTPETNVSVRKRFVFPKLTNLCWHPYCAIGPSAAETGGLTSLIVALMVFSTDAWSTTGCRMDTRKKAWYSMMRGKRQLFISHRKKIEKVYRYSTEKTEEKRCC